MEGHVKGPSLAGRFAAAILLTIGFYVLALALAAALIGLPLYGWIEGGSGNIWITLTCLFLGGSILVAIFPRRSRFEPPGVRVDEHTQPRLLELIRAESKAAGEDPPDEVYATMEVNAAVAEAGRRGRVMIVGLPLMHLLSERGLRSVIAHELGHYAGGDTRLGPWIYRTREAIGRTIANLTDDDGEDSWSQRAVRQPFIWYGRAFLRLTNAISRRQEFAADAFAARRAGRDVHREALRRIHAFAPGFDAYWEQDVVPVLSGGARPPLAAGFALFTTSEDIEQAAQRHLESELAEGRTDPYDSHPSLPERLAAVEELPPGDPDESPPGIELLDRPGELEEELLVHLFGPETRGDLRPIRWEEVGARVYLPGYERLAMDHAWVLEGVTMATLPAAVDRLGETAGELMNRDRELPVEAAPQLGAAILGAAAVTALHRDGWAVEALPGQPVLCRRGETALSPHAAVAAMREGRLDAERWEREARELGIADLSLEPVEDRSSADAPGGTTAGDGSSADDRATTPAAGD